MRVMVTKQFYGCTDDNVIPRSILVGEIIHGELGALALKEKWATDKFEEPKAKKADAKAAPAPAADGPATATEADGPETGETIPIPADWKTKPYFALQKMADVIKGDKVKDKAECLAVIQAEIDRRAAAAAPMTTASLKT